jgi:hypothetical protein
MLRAIGAVRCRLRKSSRLSMSVAGARQVAIAKSAHAVTCRVLAVFLCLSNEAGPGTRACHRGSPAAQRSNQHSFANVLRVFQGTVRICCAVVHRYCPVQHALCKICRIYAAKRCIALTSIPSASHESFPMWALTHVMYGTRYPLADFMIGSGLAKASHRSTVQRV